MYIVRNKKTKQVIHMANSVPGVDLKPEQVFQGFDPKTMEMGRFHAQYLPDEFTIEDGVVKVPEQEEPEFDLDALKALKLSQASRLSFEERQKLIPDHELLNAALGIYPDQRTKQIQGTVKAFRDAYHQYQEALGKTKTRKAVEALEPKFPKKLVGA